MLSNEFAVTGLIVMGLFAAPWVIGLVISIVRVLRKKG